MACTCSPKSSKMCDSCLRAAAPRVIGSNVKANGEFTLNQVEEFTRQFEATIVADVENNPLTKVVKRFGNEFYDSLNKVNTEFLQRPDIVNQLPDYKVISERLTYGPITALEYAAFLSDSNYTPGSAIINGNANGSKFIRELDNYYNGDFSDSVLGGFCSLFGNIFGAIGGFFNILGTVGALISDALEFISKIRNIEDPIKALFDAIKVKALIEAIKEKIASMIEGVIQKVKDMVSNFDAAQIMENISNAIQTKILDRITNIKNDIMLFFSEENTGRLKDKIKGIIDYCIGLFDNPSLEEIQFLIARICAFATGIEGLIKGLKAPLDNFSNRYQEVFNTLENAGNRVTSAAIQSGAVRYTREARQEAAGQTQNTWNDATPSPTPRPILRELVSPIRPEELQELANDTWEKFRDGQVYWIKPNPGSGWLTRESAKPTHEAWTVLTNDVKVRAKRLHGICTREGLISGPWLMTSGYRSPRDNAYLRSRSSKVAKNSLHMQKIAIDLSNVGWNKSDWRQIRQYARDCGFGGVGFYPPGEGNFIHFDLGAIRNWGTGS